MSGAKRYIRPAARNGGGAKRRSPYFMTDSTRTSADLDPRRRKALFRAWHRGMREMDLVLGQFANTHIADFSEEELAGFEAILEIGDRDLNQWIMGEAPVPADHDTPALRRVLDFRNSLKF
jgi:antitoxin CptB